MVARVTVSSKPLPPLTPGSGGESGSDFNLGGRIGGQGSDREFDCGPSKLSTATAAAAAAVGGVAAKTAASVATISSAEKAEVAVEAVESPSQSGSSDAQTAGSPVQGAAKSGGTAGVQVGTAVRYGIVWLHDVVDLGATCLSDDRGLYVHLRRCSRPGRARVFCHDQTRDVDQRRDVA